MKTWPNGGVTGLIGGEARQDGFDLVSENGKQLFEGDRMGASIAAKVVRVELWCDTEQE